MIKAQDAKKSTKAKPQVSIEEYLDSRVKTAIDKGYSSTLAWVGKDNLAQAKSLLSAAGYTVEVAVEEPNSTQLSISW